MNHHSLKHYERTRLPMGISLRKFVIVIVIANSKYLLFANCLQVKEKYIIYRIYVLKSNYSSWIKHINPCKKKNKSQQLVLTHCNHFTFLQINRLKLYRNRLEISTTISYAWFKFYYRSFTLYSLLNVSPTIRRQLTTKAFKYKTVSST